jgi:hypothetical protein
MVKTNSNTVKASAYKKIVNGRRRSTRGTIGIKPLSAAYDLPGKDFVPNNSPSSNEATRAGQPKTKTANNRGTIVYGTGDRPTTLDLRKS